jgi:hypothetical protein
MTCTASPENLTDAEHDVATVYGNPTGHRRVRPVTHGDLRSRPRMRLIPQL